MPRPKRRTESQLAGDASEAFVADWLAGRGWTILVRNLRLGRKEVDLVAVDPGPPARLTIVEVRWRRGHAFGWPEETFDWRKQGHLRAAVARLAVLKRLPDGRTVPGLPIAVDLVVVEPASGGTNGASIRHHRDVLSG
jgi:Holliday junction resolvase-like predicted endonuclease